PAPMPELPPRARPRSLRNSDAWHPPFQTFRAQPLTSGRPGQVAAYTRQPAMRQIKSRAGRSCIMPSLLGKEKDMKRPILLAATAALVFLAACEDWNRHDRMVADGLAGAA